MFSTEFAKSALLDSPSLSRNGLPETRFSPMFLAEKGLGMSPFEKQRLSLPKSCDSHNIMFHLSPIFAAHFGPATLRDLKAICLGQGEHNVGHVTHKEAQS